MICFVILHGLFVSGHKLSEGLEFILGLCEGVFKPKLLDKILFNYGEGFRSI